MPLNSKTCPICQAQAKPTARYCPQCGRLLVAAVSHADPTTLDSAAQHATQAQTTQRANPDSTVLDRTLINDPPADRAVRTEPLATIQIDPAGRYRMHTLLGKGGFGEAYLAIDTRLGRRCVVKRLIFAADWPPETRQLATRSFSDEARLLVSLNTPGHPHIPEIYDFFEESRALVMKYIPGKSLADLVQQQGPLALDLVLPIARDLAAALFYMHGRAPHPVLHRDLKPGNVLVDSEQRVWLIDFGLAEEAASVASVVAGTPGYTPPEQWRGHAEPASDVYALAATMHFLLTQFQYAVEQRPALIQGELALPALRTLLPSAPAILEDLLIRCMASEPYTRPAVSAVLATIEQLIGQRRIPTPPPLAPPPLVALLAGREQDLATYQQLLAQGHVVVLAGVAGMGKSSLAAALAVKSHTTSQICWYQCHAGSGAEGLIWQLAAFLAHQGQANLWETLEGARLSGGQPPPLTTLINYCITLLNASQSGLLLMLDDLHLILDQPLVRSFCEQLLAIAQTGKLDLLITSRSMPTLAGLPAMPPFVGLRLAGAQQLFAQRGVALPAATIDQLVQYTGGNIQLLTLAGDLFRQQELLPTANLLERLASSQDVERFLLREVDSGLDQQQRMLLGAVAVLQTNQGTRDAIEALLEQGARSILADLSERGLLVVYQGANERVYGLHDMLRSFFYEQLSRAQRRTFHRRAAVFYETDAPDPLQAAIHYERANEANRAAEIVAREAWAIAGAGQAQSLQQLLDRLSKQPLDRLPQAGMLIALGDIEWLLGSMLDPIQSAYQRALATLEDAGDQQQYRVLRAKACRGLGRALELSYPDQALQWLEQGLEALGGVDRIEEAELCNKLAGVNIRLGQLLITEQLLDRAELLMPPGPSALRINLLHTRGTLVSIRGDITGGIAVTRRAIALCEQLHDSVRAGKLLSNLGADLVIAGDLVDAQQQLAKALNLGQTTGDQQLQLMALGNAAQATLRIGDLVAAEQILHQTIALAQSMQSHVFTASSQCSLIDCLLRHKRLAEALAIFEEANQLIQSFQIDGLLPELERLHALIALAQQQPQQALIAIQSSITLAQAQGQDREEGMSLQVLGNIQLALEQPAPALASFANAVTLLEGADPYEAARAKIDWSRAIASSDPTQSAALLSAAQRELARQGAAIP